MARKRTYDEIMNDFADVYCDLSPENLTCDGMVPPDPQQVRGLHAKLRELADEMGRMVTSYEALEWDEAQQNAKICKGA